jgi:hypothetical protein
MFGQSYSKHEGDFDQPLRFRTGKFNTKVDVEVFDRLTGAGWRAARASWPPTTRPSSMWSGPTRGG